MFDHNIVLEVDHEQAKVLCRNCEGHYIVQRSSVDNSPPEVEFGCPHCAAVELYVRQCGHRPPEPYSVSSRKKEDLP